MNGCFVKHYGLYVFAQYGPRVTKGFLYMRVYTCRLFARQVQLGDDGCSWGMTATLR